MARQRWSLTLGIAAAASVVFSALPAGCGQKKVSAQSYYSAASSGRSAAAASMAADWRAKRLKLDECINLAFERLDGPGDAESVAFAGAVLDMAAIVEKELPQSGEFEMFWVRLGSLAGLAAEKAYMRGDVKEARTVVLAGPQRWQTEAFWRRHTGHDALAAIILYQCGEGVEAMRRLRSRPDLDQETQDAYDLINRGLPPKGPGG